MRLISADLDFKLIQKGGRVAYVDCKCFKLEKFHYSNLNPRQIERALLYRNWGIPSGFLVWLMKKNEIVYYDGVVVFDKGPGSGFCSSDGLLLGSFEKFDLKRIFSEFPAAAYSSQLIG